MKRLLVPLVAGITVVMAVATVAATAGTAGATTRTGLHGHGVSPRTVACNPPTASTPTVAMADTGNIVKNSTPQVFGCGWPSGDNIVLAECNGDGATGSDLSGCAIDTTGPAITVTSSGTWASATSAGAGQTLLTMKEGKMTSNAYSSCPPTITQAAHGVQCIVGAGDISNLSKAGFVPISFTPPPLTLKLGTSHLVKGVRVWNLTIREEHSYVATKTGLNESGFLTYGTTSTGSLDCQPSTNGTTWSTPGLPLCTVIHGEPIKIIVGGKLKTTIDVDHGLVNAGDFAYVVKNLKAGTYTIKVEGTVSKDILTTSVHI